MKCDKCGHTWSEYNDWINCGDFGGIKDRFLCHECWIKELDHLG